MSVMIGRSWLVGLYPLVKLGRSVWFICNVNVVISTSFTDVGGVAVGAIDLIYCSLSVPRFVSVFDVSQ